MENKLWKDYVERRVLIKRILGIGCTISEAIVEEVSSNTKYVKLRCINTEGKSYISWHDIDEYGIVDVLEDNSISTKTPEVKIVTKEIGRQWVWYMDPCECCPTRLNGMCVLICQIKHDYEYRKNGVEMSMKQNNSDKKTSIYHTVDTTPEFNHE